MNILKIIAVIAIIVAVAFAAIYILGMFEQTKPIADAATGLAGQAQEYVTNNIPTVVAAAGSVTAIAGGALSKVQSAQKQVSGIQSQATSQIDQLKQQATDTTEAAKTQVSEANKQVEAYKQQMETMKADYETKLKGTTEMQDELLKAQNMLTSSQMQKQEIQGELKTLQIRYEEVVNMKKVP